jgi:hypothetical protein
VEALSKINFGDFRIGRTLIALHDHPAALFVPSTMLSERTGRTDYRGFTP